jgi:hypothetical protein
MNIAQKITFGLIGGGWRSGFFLRSAGELPERFQVCGMVTGIPEQTAHIRARLGIPLYESAEALLEHQTPDFLVVSTNRGPGVTPDPLKSLVQLGVPILVETPAARGYESLREVYEFCRGKKVQVAEQLHAQPETAARLAIAQSGILGTVTQAELSFQQTYHCMNVLRRFLGVRFENAEICARRYSYPVVQGYTRSGVAQTEQLARERRDVALLDFNGKLGLYDYETNQVRSYVRGEHICIRGERGEINDRTVRWLQTHQDFRSYTYERLYSGAQTNLEGFHFRGLMGAGYWLYRNPYPHTHLSDDEIAVTAMLDNMARYVREGVEFSSMADACQDQYLSMMIEKAALEKKPVVTETQVWANLSAS